MSESDPLSLKKVAAHAVIEKVSREVLEQLYSLTYVPVVMYLNRIFSYNPDYPIPLFLSEFIDEFPELVFESTYRSIPKKNCGRRFHFRNDKSAEPKVIYCMEVRCIDININTRIIDWLKKRGCNPINVIELLKPENGIPRCTIHDCCCQDMGVGLSW